MTVPKVGEIIQLDQYRLGPERRDESNQNKDLDEEKPSNMRDFSSVFFLAQFENQVLYKRLEWLVSTRKIDKTSQKYSQEKSRLINLGQTETDLIKILRGATIESAKGKEVYYLIIHDILSDKHPFEE